jgi:hypothetical protein
MNKWWILLLTLTTVAISVAEDYRNAYARVQSKLSQIHAMEDQINHLIDAKAHAHSAEQARNYTDEMASTHRQLQEIYKTYHQELTKLRYQFPDKGEDFQRKYPRLELKTLEEMERAYTLNSQLTRLQSKVRTIYLNPEKKDDGRGPASSKQRYEWYEPPALIK